MEKHQKFSIWYVLLGIWLVLIAQQYLGAFFSIEVIPYSQFLKLLKENKISEVAISANQIQGKMKVEGEGVDKEKMFRSIRVDPETSNLLEQYNVPFKGEIESDFLPRLLSWIVPTAIFFGIWFFFMRRMMGQQHGVYDIGKE
ncbi:MAG: ATP-dependent metallopeptidase FtsH/Yme1/Tma family protein [Desulfobacterales bacterium]